MDPERRREVLVLDRAPAPVDPLPVAISPTRRRPGHPWTLILAIGLVAALVAAVHWPVLGARALSFDDNEYVFGNSLVMRPGWSSVGRFFGEVVNPSSVRAYYHPLSMTSLMLDAAMGGGLDDPRVFHRTNLALHVVTTVLLVLTLYRLFGLLIPAALVGLAFGLHPLTVEPVAWIAERKTLLATAIALCSVLAYLEYVHRKRSAWLLAALALNATALLAKPTVLMLPLLLLILDARPLRRFGAGAVIEKWPFLALSLLIAAVTFVTQRTAGLGEMDYTLWPLRAGYALASYLWRMVWPADLSCVYPMPTPFTLANPAVSLALAGVSSLTVLLVVLARRFPGALAGWLGFILAIAPTLVVSHSWMLTADKYFYFPFLCIAVALGGGMAATWNAVAGVARVALLVPFIVLLALEAGASRRTYRPWSDSLTLYRHMEKVAPAAPAVHAQLGVILQQAGARDEALLHLRRALELEPDYPAAHYNLGIALAGAGRLDEAIRHFRTADRLLPDDPPTVYNLGVALRLSGRLDEADTELRRALRLAPGHPEAANELGGVLIAQGRFDEAATTFRGALAVAPDHGRLHYGLAAAVRRSGGPASEARDHLREAMRLEPRWPQPCNDLAWLLATSPDSTVRDPEEALRLATQAVTLSGGNDPTVLDTRATAEAAAGRFDAAVETERQAIALAGEAGREALAAELRGRMRLYEARRVYVERRGGGTPR